MSRKKAIFTLVVVVSLVGSLIHTKVYDETFNKDVKKILSLRDLNSTMISFVVENKDKNSVSDLQGDMNILAAEDNKENEMEIAAKLEEKEINNEVVVAENVIKDEERTDDTNNTNIDNSSTNNTNSNTSNSVPEKRVNQSTPNRGATETRKRENNEVPKGYLNEYVLKVIKTYPTGSSKYPYLLNNDYENYNGVTENIYYKGKLLLKTHPSGIKYSHCSGITFEVFFKAMKMRNEELGKNTDDLNGMTVEQLNDFIMTWYVANGDKSQSNLSIALERYGLGERITNMEDLRQGDFIDFSRENNTGHSAVFINWIREGDKIIGFKYWSSQSSTNGIGYKEEYFNIKDKNGHKYGNVMIDYFIMARVR